MRRQMPPKWRRMFTKSKADSLGIRVLEVTAKPGKSVAMHSHPEAALYVIEGGAIEFTNKDGSKQVRELQKGNGSGTACGIT